MGSERGLTRRLGRAFLVQAIYIGIAGIVGVVASGLLIEEVLIKQALRDEAGYFWRSHADSPDFPLPDTQNLTGYMQIADGGKGVPEYLADYGVGFNHLPESAGFSLAYITERAGERLYLVFDGDRVSELATYFGLVPLAGVLVVLYLSMWLAYRISQRAVSPVIALARKVSALDPEAPDTSALDPERLGADTDDEVRILGQAVAGFAGRLNSFVERERNFTRDASHELRSPLTVIKIAADLLLADPQFSAAGRDSLQRIRRAVTDMEELTEAFLMLARESDRGLPREPVSINDVVTEELERARLVTGNHMVDVESTADCRLFVVGSPKVLSSLIGNLLRNAFSYTSAGRVRVHVAADSVTIEDSGAGIPGPQVERMFKPFERGGRGRGGHGVGLTIVRRLSDRFGWPLSLDSTPGVGTKVLLRFPDSRAEALNAPAEAG